MRIGGPHSADIELLVFVIRKVKPKHEHNTYRATSTHLYLMLALVDANVGAAFLVIVNTNSPMY